MGEIADELFNRLFDWDDRNYFGDEDEDPPRRGDRRCQYCGVSGLAWVELEEGWRLYCPQTGVIHKCLPRQIPFDPTKITF